MRYTGIVENHRVEVGAIAGAKVSGKCVELFFSNNASGCGYTVVRIPEERFCLTLGGELSNWLLLAMESRLEATPAPEELIDAADLIEVRRKSVGVSRFFEMMFADKDDETVTVAVPEDEAIKELGERLYWRIVERGELVRLKILKAINNACMGGA